MSRERTTPFAVVMQGRPVMSHTYGYLVRGNDEVVTFYVDLDSKHCRVTGSGGETEDEGPMIFISETENSLHLGPATDKECDTVIQFTEFPGWNVHAAQLSKYTLAVALTKPITAYAKVSGAGTASAGLPG